MSTTPDTRKIPDDILQAAIDAALIASQLTGFDSSEFQPGWTSQSTHRLALARGLLARLPEPTPPVSADGKTPGQVAFEASGRISQHLEWIHYQDEWAKVASAVIAAFGQPSLDAAIARAEKAEAVLAAVTADRNRLDKRLTETLLAPSLLPQLRPITEAGDVPEGCVRVGVLMKTEGYVINPTMAFPSHFADIRLPSPAASQDSQPAIATLAQDQIQATPAMQAAADAVLREDLGLAPAWQPAVGDVVQLKSAGPVMTVNAIESKGLLDVIWISPDGYLQSASLPAACLTPAQEAQP